MSYSSKVYRAQGGDRLVVEASGSVQVKTGGQVIGGATVDAEARRTHSESAPPHAEVWEALFRRCSEMH